MWMGEGAAFVRAEVQFSREHKVEGCGPAKKRKKLRTEDVGVEIDMSFKEEFLEPQPCSSSPTLACGLLQAA